MPKIFVHTLSVISVCYLLMACSGDGSGSNSGDGNVFGQGLNSDFANHLTGNTWCTVNDSGQPFDRDVALAYTYLKDGSAEVRSVQVELVNGKQASAKEETVTAIWGYSNGTLYIRNQRSGETIKSRVEWIKHSPSPSADAVWKSGITMGEQTCLKAHDDSDTAKYGIHCKCDFDKIKNR